MPSKLHLLCGKAIQLGSGQERVDMDKKICDKDETCLRGNLGEVGKNVPNSAKSLEQPGTPPKLSQALPPTSRACGSRKVCRLKEE